MPKLQKEAAEAANLEFHQWKQHPVTKDFFAFLAEQINNKAKDWAEGQFNGSDLHSFVAQNATAQGAVTVMRDLVTLEFKDIYEIEGENDGEQQQQERHPPYRGSGPYLPGRN